MDDWRLSTRVSTSDADAALSSALLKMNEKAASEYYVGGWVGFIGGFGGGRVFGVGGGGCWGGGGISAGESRCGRFAQGLGLGIRGGVLAGGRFGEGGGGIGRWERVTWYM